MRFPIAIARREQKGQAHQEGVGYASKWWGTIMGLPLLRERRVALSRGGWGGAADAGCSRRQPYARPGVDKGGEGWTRRGVMTRCSTYRDSVRGSLCLRNVISNLVAVLAQRYAGGAAAAWG